MAVIQVNPGRIKRPRAAATAAGQRAVGGGWWVVGGGWWAVGGGRWAVGGSEKLNVVRSVSRRLVDMCSAFLLIDL